MTDTLAALDAAIQAHIATAYEGAFVDGWVLVTSSQALEHHDESNYRIVTPETQPFHVDCGLVEIARKITGDAWDAAFDGGDD